MKPLVTVSPVKKTPAAAEVPAKPVKAAEPTKLIDLNTASQPELESLPEIGKSSAKKIIAARPYASVDDLAKTGLTAKIIADREALVTVSAARPKATAPVTPAKTAPAVGPGNRSSSSANQSQRPRPRPPLLQAKLAPGQMVNINTASKEMLEALPEIGPVKAQAIIDNRPYKKIDDIMKVKGIKEGTFNKIKDHDYGGLTANTKERLENHLLRSF